MKNQSSPLGFSFLVVLLFVTPLFAENTSVRISGALLRGRVFSLAGGKSILLKLNNEPAKTLTGKAYSFANSNLDIIINSNPSVTPNTLTLVQEPLDQDCYFGNPRGGFRSNTVNFKVTRNVRGEIVRTNLPPISCDSAMALSGSSIRGTVENLGAGGSLRMQYGNHPPITVTPDRNGTISFRAHDLGPDRLITTVRGGSDVIRIIHTPGQQECFFEPSSNRTRIYRFDDVFVQRDPRTRRIIAGGTVPINQTVSEDRTSMSFNYFVPFLNFRPMGFPNFHVYLPQNYVIHCK